jgi:mRNA interferase RelE/StbE
MNYKYKITISKQARKKLQTLDKPTQLKIVDKLNVLSYNPDDNSLDIKRLTGEPYYRLRVGDWRVIFSKNEALKIIAVEKLNSRGEVYK